MNTPGWAEKVFSPANLKSMAYGALAVAIVLSLDLFLLAYRAPRDALVPESAVAVARDGISLGYRGIPLLVSCAGGEPFVPGNYEFRMTLDIPDGDPAGGKSVLVFPRIAGSSLEVFLNGVLIGIRGDPVTGRSTVWNSVHIFSIPEGLLSEKNTIVARIAGTYEAGITAEPYLMDPERHGPRLFLLMFFSNYAIWLCMGGLFAISLIVLSMGLFDDTSRLANILLGFAGIAVAIFLTDFVYLERLPFSLVAFKKIVVSLRHLSAAFFVIAYLKLLGRKPDPFAMIFTAIQLACFVLVIAYPGSIVDIKRLYGWTYLSFLPLQAYLLVIVFISTMQEGPLRIMVFGVLVAFLSATRDIALLILARDGGAIMVSHYGFIILTLSASAFVVNDALRHYSALVVEKRRAASFREEALRDELTGCYNRKILSALAEDLKKPFSVLAFDIDDFKSANDKFGHATGDSILVDLVRLARKNIRADDCVVRTGGDEFLLVLRSCPLEAACAVADQLIGDCAHAHVPLTEVPRSETGGQGFASYSISIGVAYCEEGAPTILQSLLAAQRRADAELYRAKKAGKGRWCAG